MLGLMYRAARAAYLAPVLAAFALAGLMPAGQASAAAAVSPAAATPWAIQASPNATIPGGQIDSVSCSSARACTGVGTYVNTADITVTLAEEWTGTSWQQQATPNPAAGTVASQRPSLAGVSCPSADSCEAVGTYGQGGSEFGFAEGWNGRSWQLQAMPAPASPVAGLTLAELFAVSCASPTFCEAVGTYENSSGLVVPLAERFNGSSWTLESPPAPPGSTDAVLTGVSCVSRKFCEATSTTQRFSTTPPFADLWNGKSWQLQSFPASITQSVGQVSCASATFCEAVSSSAGGSQATAAVWNGTSWASQPIASPPAAAFSNLTGVSCVSASFCEAVGSYTDSSAASFAWAAVWDGSSWSVQFVPGQAGAYLTSVNAVSCSGVAACEAGGSFQQSAQAAVPQALAEAWNGSSWNVQQAAAPAGATDNRLNAVSCPTATFCETVGEYTDAAGNQVSLAEAWNGTSWQVQASSGAAGMLNGVSCVSAVFCEAVGSSGSGPAAQMWNGTSWSAQAIPGTDFLTSVSCVSATFCIAVGNNAATDVWDGTSWSTAAGPPGFTLSSVSCASATFCEAVGFGASGDAAMWNGASWTAQPTPTPAGDAAQSLGLESVSCTTAQFCVTVGSADTSTFSAVTAAEVWDGTAWTAQPTPNPAAATDSVLNAVSCTSATDCAAVGSFGTPSDNTLAEGWDGSAWTLRSTPNAGGASSDVLLGVSCTPVACTASGDSTALTDATLVESGT